MEPPVNSFVCNLLGSPKRTQQTHLTAVHAVTSANVVAVVVVGSGGGGVPNLQASNKSNLKKKHLELKRMPNMALLVWCCTIPMQLCTVFLHELNNS